VSDNIYVTVDVDVMDPAVAPGTGTLEPGGLSFFQLDDLLTGLGAKGRLVAWTLSKWMTETTVAGLRRPQCDS